MIPLRDVIPSRTFPIVTVLIIAANSLVWITELGLPEDRLHDFLLAYGIVPLDFRWLSLFTSMFLHAGWLHFLGNMLYLWIFGDNVEDRMGHVRYAAFYLLCGATAGFAHITIKSASSVPTIGASGAIAGVMGAYFTLYPRSRVLALVPLVVMMDVVEVPAVFFLGLWFLVQFAGGAGSLTMRAAESTAGIAFWAHVAGFAAGFLGVFIFQRPERQRVEWWS